MSKKNGLLTDFKLGINLENMIDREKTFGHNRSKVTELKVVSIVIEVSTSDNREIAWVEGFAIFVAVFVCAMVTAVTDY